MDVIKEYFVGEWPDEPGRDYRTVALMVELRKYYRTLTTEADKTIFRILTGISGMLRKIDRGKSRRIPNLTL